MQGSDLFIGGETLTPEVVTDAAALTGADTGGGCGGGGGQVAGE